MKKEFITVELSNKQTCLIEVENASEIEQVGTGKNILSLVDVKEQIKGFVTDISEAVSKLNQTKTTLEFGIELGVETGALTALFVKGTGKSNLKITLEWDKSNK